MDRRRHPIPTNLGNVFTAGAARAAGVDSRRRHGDDVVRIAPGTYARVDGEVVAVPASHGSDRQPHPHERWRQSIALRAIKLSEVMKPNAFFSHHTAAVLWGLPVAPPFGDAQLRVDVGSCEGSRSHELCGVKYRTLSSRQVRVVALRGIPVVDPATTWAQLSPGLPRSDAVALGDAVLRHPRYPGTSRYKRDPLATLPQLEQAATTPYRRGGRSLRELLPALTHQSASPPESHLRVLLEAWGAPRPVLDYDVYSADGHLFGCSEFAYPRLRLAIEYEGEHHFSLAKQFVRDVEKYQAYAEHGWRVLRVTSSLLYRQPLELKRQLFAALSQRREASS